MGQAMDQGRVVSTASLSLLSPADRGSAPRGDPVGELRRDGRNLAGQRRAYARRDARSDGGAGSHRPILSRRPRRPDSARRAETLDAVTATTGGIPIGGLALAVSLDDIARAVLTEARNTTLIAFALLGFAAAAALRGTYRSTPLAPLCRPAIWCRSGTDRRGSWIIRQGIRQPALFPIERRLSLLSPADRGVWVASPIINTGGIPIGGLAAAPP